MYINTQIWIMFFLQIYFYIFVFLYCKLQDVFMTIFNFWHTFNNHLIIERTNKTYKILQIFDFVKDLYFKHTPYHWNRWREGRLIIISFRPWRLLFAHFLKIHSELVYSAKNVSINRLQFEIKTIYWWRCHGIHCSLRN